jgi:hypothetical protein
MQRDMVAKRGVHMCALVVSMQWVIDCVVLRRKLLDPMPYLVPTGTPAPAPRRARSHSAGSADTPLSRKRARIPAPGPSNAPAPPAAPAPAPDSEDEDSDYDERSDDDAEMQDVSERDSRNVARLIALLKEWDGEGGKMVFIQRCVSTPQV